MSEKTTGRVKWFNEKKGFGFILGEQGDDVFVHYLDISGDGFRTLHENDLVSFILIKGPKGYKAQGVDVITKS